MQLLKQGMFGEDIRHFQVLINGLAPPAPKLVEDGIFGPKTRDGIVKFQLSSGLSPDGIIGPKTTVALLRKMGFSL